VLWSVFYSFARSVAVKATIALVFHFR